MSKTLIKIKSSLLFVSFVSSFCSFTVFSSDVMAATTIVAGTDYLYTKSAQLCMGGSCYSFTGYPDVFGPHGYDTLVQRTNIDVQTSGYGTIPSIGPLTNINVTGLSLYSSALNLYATLHPAAPGFTSAGNMNIYDGSTGNVYPANTPTFTSNFNVWVDLCSQPGTNGVGCRLGATPQATIFKNFTLDETPWISRPKGYLLSGPIGNTAANYHFDLSGNYLPQGNLSDFFIKEEAMHDDGNGGYHVVEMPEINGGVLPKGLYIIAGVFIMLFRSNKSVKT